MSIISLFLTLIYISITNYLPSHLYFLRNRFAYYVYGDETVPIFSDAFGLGFGWLGVLAGMVGWGKEVGVERVKVVGSGITSGIASTGSQGVTGTVMRVVVTGRPEL